MPRRDDYINEPRWIRARYPDACPCGRDIRPGQNIYYHPSADRGKRTLCQNWGRNRPNQRAESLTKAVCKTI